MSNNQEYLDEIERLEKEREELLKRLSPEELAHYEEVKRRFSEINHGKDQDKKPYNPNNY